MLHNVWIVSEDEESRGSGSDGDEPNGPRSPPNNADDVMAYIQSNAKVYVPDWAVANKEPTWDLEDLPWAPGCRVFRKVEDQEMEAVVACFLPDDIAAVLPVRAQKIQLWHADAIVGIHNREVTRKQAMRAASKFCGTSIIQHIKHYNLK